MNIPEHEIENALRRAPAPKPPERLRQDLIKGIPHLPGQSAARKGLHDRPGWLRRWWPALAPAGISVACALAYNAQQTEIRDLQQSIASLAPAAATAAAEVSANPQKTALAAATESEQEEIARLKG